MQDITIQAPILGAISTVKVQTTLINGNSATSYRLLAPWGKQVSGCKNTWIVQAVQHDDIFTCTLWSYQLIWLWRILTRCNMQKVGECQQISFIIHKPSSNQKKCLIRTNILTCWLCLAWNVNISESGYNTDIKHTYKTTCFCNVNVKLDSQISKLLQCVMPGLQAVVCEPLRHKLWQQHGIPHFDTVFTLLGLSLFVETFF